MVARVEVVTSVERRRRFSDAEKLRFVAETESDGVAAVSRKAGVSQGLLFAWRRAVREGKLGTPASDTRADMPAPSPPPFIRVHASALEPTSIRVGFPNGVTIDVPASMEPQRLAALVRALGEPSH